MCTRLPIPSVSLPFPRVTIPVSARQGCWSRWTGCGRCAIRSWAATSQSSTDRGMCRCPGCGNSSLSQERCRGRRSHCKNRPRTPLRWSHRTRPGTRTALRWSHRPRRPGTLPHRSHQARTPPRRSHRTSTSILPHRSHRTRLLWITVPRRSHRPRTRTRTPQRWSHWTRTPPRPSHST